MPWFSCGIYRVNDVLFIYYLFTREDRIQLRITYYWNFLSHVLLRDGGVCLLNAALTMIMHGEMASFGCFVFSVMTIKTRFVMIWRNF